jgi:hypothetical protein
MQITLHSIAIVTASLDFIFQYVFGQGFGLQIPFDHWVKDVKEENEAGK